MDATARLAAGRGGACGRQGRGQIGDDLECLSKDFGPDSITQVESRRVVEQKGCELKSVLQKLNHTETCAMNLIGGFQN